MSILAWTAKKEPAASGEPGEARSLDSKFYLKITGVCAQATTVARQVQSVPLYNLETFYSEIISENSLFMQKRSRVLHKWHTGRAARMRGALEIRVGSGCPRVTFGVCWR
jgi:hypothetical protein